MLKKCKFCPFDKSSDLSYDLILEALLQINGWVKYKYNYGKMLVVALATYITYDKRLRRF